MKIKTDLRFGVTTTTMMMMMIIIIIIIIITRTIFIRSFHSIHNVVDRGVLQAMWEGLAGQVVHRDQLIIC